MIRQVRLGLIGLAFLSTLVFLPSCSPDQSKENSVSITAAGATFPYPLYEKWFADYHQLHPDVKISYQSIGSGAGVTQFLQGTIDLGASDVAMTRQEIATAKRGVLLVPVTAGGIVVSYNLPGVDGLKLNREVLASIFSGKITRWDDAAIAASNPEVRLPALPITVVHRSDGSGTTKLFTAHLSAISPSWKAGPGSGKSIQWPTGNGAKGNEGVAALLKQTEGSISYLEYGYAKSQVLQMAQLQNRSGEFVVYSYQSARISLQSISLDGKNIGFDADPAAPGAWPITSYTWLIVHENNAGDSRKAQAIEDVLLFALQDGQKVSASLGYIPLPDSVVNKMLPQVEKINP
jgi:phosphate transport system substrate-binding protein